MERLGSIRSIYQPLVESEKNSERMAAVVDFLFGRPIFSAKQLAEGLEMHFKTSRQYIKKLVEAGILLEISGYARNQIYQADDIFNTLDKIRD